MKIWYYDIPEGVYTTRELIELSKPKQTYNCVYKALVRLRVEFVRQNKNIAGYNIKNEGLWKWKGAKFYLKI